VVDYLSPGQILVSRGAAVMNDQTP